VFRFIPVLAACALCHAAAAQTIYKCRVDGKVAYGDTPCVSGDSVELAVPAVHPPVHAPAPASSPARDKASLAQLEKLRLTRELHEQREQARDRRAAAAHREKCDKLRLRRKWTEEDLARTAGPATEPLRLKLRRQAEAMAVECPG
jgi:hypothetical protein